MRTLTFPGSRLGMRPTVRFRPRPAVFVIYLGIMLAVELLAEAWLASAAPPIRALARWSVLALIAAPACLLVALRATQADRELEANAERDLVRKLALALTAEYEPDRVPGLLVRQARELVGARLAFLARPDGDAYRIEIVAGEASHRLIGERLPINRDSPGIAGEAIRTGQTQFLPDTWCEADLAARRELGLSDKIRSAAAIPLVVRGEIVGLIGLHAEATQQINRDKVELLELYAEQAVGPFENALLAASVSQLDAAKQLDQLKSEFLSAVAHELRAPLSPMLGWAELLLARDYAPEQARPMLEHIYEGAQHLSVLVGDLLDLSRGEAGRLSLDLQDVDLGDLLQDAVERWREQAPRHHFVLAVAGSLPLRADRHRLRQVLDNLLSNAAKYSNPETRIFVTARSEAGGHVVVRVSDQGIGLTAEDREKLFSKFFRTDAARRQATGTGLGLALCRLIVQAHGGDIIVESEGIGQGSAFTFSVPAAGPPDEARPPAASFAAARG